MVKAKKELGQNFLKDRTYLLKIIEAMPNNARPVLEIGPGLGDLTQELLRKRQVVAVEIDRDLVAILNRQLSKELQEGRLRLIEDDVLAAWERGPLIEGEYDLVANLPYYVATQIILHALQDKNCREIIVMVQKEVGVKLAAASGDREFGALSVLAQCNSQVELLFDVPPEAFDPAPKVTSAVVRIIKDPSTSQEIDSSFITFVHQVFHAPRKTIANNLAAFGKERIAMALAKLKIIPTLRPHQLNCDNVIALYKQLAGQA
ncbi:MAG: 16S rRNA (adenine(1518)-N(6)/adenine(1519)-N(6))-dimethyltransferase RsmA [Campylobacterales bacterium]